jgi:hypothetical protein
VRFAPTVHAPCIYTPPKPGHICMLLQYWFTTPQKGGAPPTPCGFCASSTSPTTVSSVRGIKITTYRSSCCSKSATRASTALARPTGSIL